MYFVFLFFFFVFWALGPLHLPFLLFFCLPFPFFFGIQVPGCVLNFFYVFFSFSLLFGLQVPCCIVHFFYCSFLFLRFLGSRSHVVCSISFIVLFFFFAFCAPGPLHPPFLLCSFCFPLPM